MDDLIVGGAGFIGSHVVEALVARDHQIIVLDDLSLGDLANLDAIRDEAPLIVGDASDRATFERVVRQHRPERIWHMAAIPLPRSLRDPGFVVETTVAMAAHACELALEYECRLVQFSSSEVYGTAMRPTMTESHPLRPLTPYAAAKASADLIVHAHVMSFGLQALIIRPFNTYGPRQNARHDSGIVPRSIRRGLLGLPLQISAPGSQTRDFTFVGDIADWSVRLAELAPYSGAAFNLGSGVEVRVDALVRELARRLNGQTEVVPARPGDVRRHVADATAAQELLGDFRPTSLEFGLDATIGWYQTLGMDRLRAAEAEDENARSARPAGSRHRHDATEAGHSSQASPASGDPHP